MELPLQVISLVIILVLIVLLVYKTYGHPHSEYGKILDQIPDIYVHLTDEALEEELRTAQSKLHHLEHELSRLKSSRKAKRHRIRKKIASLKVAMLLFEQYLRSIRKPDRE
jgi:uncharacterized membrane protein YgaE (UPF0421/DUF939 family)